MSQSHVLLTDAKNPICEKGYFFQNSRVLQQIQRADSKIATSTIAMSPDKKTAYLAGDENKFQVWDISEINQPKRTGEFILTEKNLQVHKIAVNNDHLFVINKNSESIKLRYASGEHSSSYCIYIYNIKNNYSFVKKLRIGNRACPDKILSIDSYLIFDSEYYHGPEIHIVDLTDVNFPKYIERISIPGEHEEKWDLSPDLKFISEEGSTFESAFLREIYKSKTMISLLSCGGYNGLHVVKEVSSIIANYSFSRKRKPTFTYLDDLMLDTFEIMYSAEEREGHFELPPNIDYSSIYLARAILRIKKQFVNALAKNEIFSTTTTSNFFPTIFSAYIDEYLDAADIVESDWCFQYMKFNNVEKFKSILKCNIPLEQEESALFARETLFLLRKEFIKCLKDYKEGGVVFSLFSSHDLWDDLWYRGCYQTGYTYQLSQENIKNAVSVLQGYLQKYLGDGFQIVSNIANVCKVKITIHPKKVEQLMLALNINPMNATSSDFFRVDIEDNKQYDLAQMKKDFIALDKPGSPIQKIILKKAMKSSQVWIEKPCKSRGERFVSSELAEVTTKLNIFLNITKAIKWCHEQGVFYGNLHSYSIISLQPLQLLGLAPNRYCLVKNESENEKKLRMWPSFDIHERAYVAYCAPELLSMASLKESNSTATGCVADEKAGIVPRYIPTEKTDVYGLGRLLYFIVYGRDPWLPESFSALGIRKAALSERLPWPLQPFKLEEPEISLPKPSATGLFAKKTESIDDEIRNEFDLLMVRCCNLKPENRPPLDEVIIRLERLAKKVEAVNAAKQKEASGLCCGIM